MASADSGVLEKGTTLAGYRIDGILGQGGMGAVYEATQLSLDRVVALKVLAAHLSDDPSFITRFQREGKIQAGIDHPHIVTVYDSGQSDRGFFIAMRLVRGPNLKDLIVARELDAGRTLRIVTPVAEALDAAHHAGLIHRDIKPQNILVGGRDQAYLADFGLTKASGDKGLTKTGQFVGTLDYISPEQIRGEPATKESDVYALAGVLYECLSGIVPYPKDSEAAVLYAHMADPPPRLSEHRPDLPVSIEQVLVKAMSKEPGDRFHSAGELMHEANRAFSRRTRAAFSPPGPIETPQETGIRPAEEAVDTREGQTQPPPDETITAPQQPETAPAAGAVPDVTRAGAAPPETQAPPPDTEPLPAETIAPAPDETRIGPGETQVGPGETQVGPGETQVGPGETQVGPEATRAAPQQPTPVPAAATAAAATAASVPGAPAQATPPPPAAAPPARRGAPVIPLILGAALILAIIGFIVGHSGGGKSTPAGTKTVSSGPVDLAAPSDWTRSAGPAQIPGLDFGKDGFTVTPSGGADSGTLTIGVTNGTGTSMLPASFTSKLGSKPPTNDGVRLGDLEALRFKGLKPQGFSSQSLTVYTSPTTEGALTFACAAPTAKATKFLPDCEKVAAAATLASGKPYPLGNDDTYSSDVTDAINSLNSQRSSGVSAMKKAKSGSSQAKAATSIANAYGSAASSLDGTQVSPQFAGQNAKLVAALKKAQGAYKSLSSNAKKGSKSGYSKASKNVSKAESQVNKALSALKGG
ncbi:MAG: protein kinase domain-containing protein [Thermoleophilaceae bacterium]